MICDKSFAGVGVSVLRLSEAVRPCMALSISLYEPPRWLSGKESAYQCRRYGFNPWSGRSPGEGNGNPLQYSCLGNPMDRRARQATVPGVTWDTTEHTRTHTYFPIWCDDQVTCGISFLKSRKKLY